MSFTHTPGNVLVDETSTFGAHAHLPSGEAADWPETRRWLERTRAWLVAITATAVGRVLLDAIGARPGGVVAIVRNPRRIEAFTDGPLAARAPGNPSGSSTVFITFTPADARSAPVDLAPMRQPGSVLVHELVHALMNSHGLNALIEPDGTRRPIAAWTSVPYPNHNEFCATTIQNMLLSETGSRLSDGYHDGDPGVDDPCIDSLPDVPAERTVFGMHAHTTLDVAGFVANYRAPLQFLDTRLGTFTSRLAALPGIAFNPFARLRASGGTGTSSGSGGRGATRRPGPTGTSPR